MIQQPITSFLTGKKSKRTFDQLTTQESAKPPSLETKQQDNADNNKAKDGDAEKKQGDEKDDAEKAAKRHKSDASDLSFVVNATSRKYSARRLDVDLYPSFLAADVCAKLANLLERAVQWRTAKHSVGKRSTQSYGETGVSYTLHIRGNTIVRNVLPWNRIPALIELRDAISKVTGQYFNYVVIQRYPNDRVGMKPHRDKELDDNTHFAGLRLVNRRTLCMVSCADPEQTIDIPLAVGSLYRVNPPTNSCGGWMHSISAEPKSRVKALCGGGQESISLTYRLFTQKVRPAK